MSGGEFGRLDERTKDHAKSIDDLYSKYDEVVRCIRRIERQQWAVMGQGAGVSILLAIVLAKVFGVVG